MSSDAVEKIANAVLYEGYILYPYRASAIKNQQRWNFGTLGPGEFMQTECLALSNARPAFDIKVRFLQMTAREGQVWNEAIDRTVREPRFTFDDDIEGTIDTTTLLIRDNLYRITVGITNTSSLAEGTREQLLLRSLVSTHTILTISNGEFISLLDPPEAYRDDAAQCKNIGTWPVLAGDEGTKDTLLSSPIILYDYPQIAPESGGDFFDGTEMDEMLALRVLTLTDAEKHEMRTGDDRARRILERTEMMPNDQMLKLHGVIRGMKAEAKKGDRVRLWPKKGGDIFDLALEGKIAIIEAVEHDFEDRVHLAVVLEDDPGRDLGEMRQPGHRFFFSPEEVESLP